MHSPESLFGWAGSGGTKLVHAFGGGGGEATMDDGVVTRVLVVLSAKSGGSTHPMTPPASAHATLAFRMADGQQSDRRYMRRRSTHEQSVGVTRRQQRVHAHRAEPERFSGARGAHFAWSSRPRASSPRTRRASLRKLCGSARSRACSTPRAGLRARTRRLRSRWRRMTRVCLERLGAPGPGAPWRVA